MNYPNWQSHSRPKHILSPLLGTHSPPLPSPARSFFLYLLMHSLELLFPYLGDLLPTETMRPSQVVLSDWPWDTSCATSAPAGPTPGISSSIPSLSQTHPFLKVKFHLLCETFPVNTLLVQEDLQEKVMSKRRPEGVCPVSLPVMALQCLQGWVDTPNLFAEHQGTRATRAKETVVLRPQVCLTPCIHPHLKLQTLAQ